MLKGMISAVLVLSGLWGVTLPISNNYYPYLHYLKGSGTPLTEATKKWKNRVREVCNTPIEDGPAYSKGESWLTTAYFEGRVSGHGLNHDVSWVLGRFHCHSNGYITDVYDFAYANDWVEDRTFFAQDLVECHLDASALQNKARCLVKRGYGKPYKIKVFIGGLKNPYE
jgi:hypothetical protein